MKICATADGKTIDAKIDPRFGRCKYFLMIETDSLEYEAIENPNAESGSGAGIQSGELMASKEVRAVLTGNVGPNAFETLKAAGIRICTGVSGVIKEAVERFKKGEFREQKSPTVKSHAGMRKGKK